MPPFAGWVLPDGLVYLSVGSNRLSGSLPTWHNPETLGALFVENNTFSGAIPAAFWATLPSSMTDLDLSQNRLTGTLSANVAIPQAMMTLTLSNNSLHGGVGGNACPATWGVGTKRPHTSCPTKTTQHFKRFACCLLAGTLPFWPTLNNTEVEVMPQNGTGFCGEVSAGLQRALALWQPLQAGSIQECWELRLLGQYSQV